MPTDHVEIDLPDLYDGKLVALLTDPLHICVRTYSGGEHCLQYRRQVITVGLHYHLQPDGSWKPWRSHTENWRIEGSLKRADDPSKDVSETTGDKIVDEITELVNATVSSDHRRESNGRRLADKLEQAKDRVQELTEELAEAEKAKKQLEWALEHVETAPLPQATE